MTKELEPIPFVGHVDLGEDTPQIEIAKSMGLSRMTVAKIEREALKKAKKLMEERKIKKDDIL